MWSGDPNPFPNEGSVHQRDPPIFGPENSATSSDGHSYRGGTCLSTKQPGWETTKTQANCSDDKYTNINSTLRSNLVLGSLSTRKWGKYGEPATTTLFVRIGLVKPLTKARSEKSKHH